MFPQKIQNVRVREKVPFAQVPEIRRAIDAAERELDGNGRVVVRYSGTEALARVMVEAESEEKMKALRRGLRGRFRRRWGCRRCTTPRCARLDSRGGCPTGLLMATAVVEQSES